MLQLSHQNRDRIKSGIGVALFHALLGYAFLTGLGFEIAGEAAKELKMFDVFEQEPPPPAQPAPPDTAPEREVAKPKDPEGAASPANLKDTPTQVMAPEPVIQLPPPPPIVAAPAAGQGTAPAAGAAPIPGPGTGAGGIGNGLGSGLYGSGTGGGGGGRGTSAIHISGRIRDSDYPLRLVRAGIGGTVLFRVAIAPNGRVTGCTVTRSSGSPELDAITCRVALQRFRYRPARDAAGRPIADTQGGEQEWIPQPSPDRWIEADVPE